MNIGKTIKALRFKAGMSQQELSYKAKIDRTYLSRVENNHCDVSQKTLEIISVVLDIPIAVIYIKSLEQNDFSNSKVDAFNFLHPKLDGFINEVFE